MQTILTKSLSDTMVYKDIPVLSYRIEYPVFSSTCDRAAVASINEFYASYAKNKENYCKTVLYPQAVEAARYIQDNNPPFHAYEFLINQKTTLNSGCITSLYQEQYTYTGGAHGSTLRTSHTWDFSTGKPVSLANLFSGEPMWRERLLKEIERQTTHRLKTTPGSFFEDYGKLLQTTFQPENFYLVPNGLVIYFQQYDIAPYATGIPEFLLV